MMIISQQDKQTEAMKKRILFVLSLIVVTMFFVTACSNDDEDDGIEGYYTSKSVKGTWAMLSNGNHVEWYWVLEDKQLKYYEHENGEKPVYFNGYIYTDDDTTWSLDHYGDYAFDEESQTIFFSGMKMGTVQWISRDEAYLSSRLLKSGTCYRIKGFKKYRDLE